MHLALANYGLKVSFTLIFFLWFYCIELNLRSWLISYLSLLAVYSDFLGLILLILAESTKLANALLGLSLLSYGTTSIGEKKHGKSQKEHEITESQNYWIMPEHYENVGIYGRNLMGIFSYI